MNKVVDIQVINQDIKDGNNSRNEQGSEEDADKNINPYQKVFSNEHSNHDNKIEQMINWSIFSNKIKYIDSCMNIMPSLSIRPLEKKT